MENKRTECVNNKETSEQWLSNGDCSICRRRTFCHKDCKARSKSIEKDVESTISNILMKRIFGGGK